MAMLLMAVGLTATAWMRNVPHTPELSVRRFRTNCLRVASVLVSSLAVAVSGTAQTPAVQDTLDVLFIGNSYTYFHNLPRLVEAISNGVDGPMIRPTALVGAGLTLPRHLGGEQVPLRLRPGSAAWSHVVLQGQSRLGTPYADEATGSIGDRAPFQAAVRSLVAMVRAVPATPVLFMTWARERFPGQTQDLAEAYQEIGVELGVPVIPAGLAWARVARERPDLELYHRDGAHPSSTGSYLAACVAYARITGHSPVGAPGTIDGVQWMDPGRPSPVGVVPLVRLSAEDARYLQEVAWESVRSAR